MTKETANAFAALNCMDKAVVEVVTAITTAYTDPDQADKAAIDILTAYQDLHTESLRLIAECA